MGCIWKDEATVDLVKKLWADGLSASQIGVRLGVTRNTIIGKVRRLRLPGRLVVRGSLAYASTRDRTGKAKIRKSHGSTSFLSPQQLALQKIRADADPVPQPAEPDIARVSFNDLDEIEIEGSKRHCRHIPAHIDPRNTKPHEPQYCGKPKVMGLPYCEGHSRRCYGTSPPPASIMRPYAPVKRQREFA